MSLKRLIKPTRGVALLTAVMFALILLAVARGMLYLRVGMGSEHEELKRRAEQASLAGLEYAKSQLAKKNDWAGNDPLGTTVDSSELKVVESAGNVIGLMQFEDGGKAQFRIRFNAQDGPDGADAKDDPNSDFFVNHKWLSANNLTGNSTVLVPAVDDNFRANTGVDAKSKLPPHAVLIQVEGRAGPSIDGLSFAQPNATVSGFVVGTKAGAVLKTVLQEQDVNAVLQSRAGLQLEKSGEFLVKNVDGSSSAIRSKGLVDLVDGANLVMPNKGTVYCSGGASGFSGSYDSSQVTIKDEASTGSDLLNIDWGDLAALENPDEIYAGVYVMWPQLGSDPPSLHYYNMSYKQYLEDVYLPMVTTGKITNEGTRVEEHFENVSPPQDPDSGGRGDGAHIKIESNAITVVNDLKIVNTTSSDGKTVEDFVVIPLDNPSCDGEEDLKTRGEDGTPYARPKEMGRVAKPGTAVGMELTPGAGTGATAPVTKPVGDARLSINIIDSTISTAGNMMLKGSTLSLANATLRGEKNLLLNTPSLSVQGSGADQSNLSLYFKNDILISTDSMVDLSGGAQSTAYGSFAVNGTIYSWGDIKIRTAPSSGGDGASGGAYSVTGSMIAFGRDLITGEPSNNKGNVSIAATSTTLTFDPAASAGIVDPNYLAEHAVLATTSFELR